LDRICYVRRESLEPDLIQKKEKLFMREIFRKLVILLILLAAPAWIYANEKHNKLSNHELATQIQQRMESVAPNTVVVVVDEATRTAYLQGSVNSQEEVDRITEALRSLDGLSVIGSNLVVNTATAASLYAEESSGNQYTVNQGDENLEMTEQNDQSDQDSQTEAPVAETPVPTDASVNAAVIHALKSEGIIGQSKIRVETEDGVVTLTGTALSEAQADRIVELARMVPGVVAVNPNLQLRDERRPYKTKPNPEVDKEGRQIEPEDNH
jgi:osmotically-inducible protein OsmY